MADDQSSLAKALGNDADRGRTTPHPSSAMQKTHVPAARDASEVTNLDFLSPSTIEGSLGTLPPFEMMRVIGRGGMGIVLEALDPCLDRRVAVKVMDPELSRDEISRKRFCREARLAAAVDHDNVVLVHSVNEDAASGLPFLVMQLIRGGSLEDRLAHGEAFSLDDIVRIGWQIAAGLAAAHAQGLIHRDVKPGNILLESDTGKVKVTDFGLARSTEDLRLTQTGMVTGTPLYMAPEQALGKTTDGRADLFSLGIVLYELCTGETPFHANTPLGVLKRITEERPRRVDALNPKIPVWLTELIGRLLEKDPNHRIQTATEVASSLETYWLTMRYASGTSPRASFRRRTWQTLAVKLGIATLLLLLGATAGVWWAFFRAPLPLEANSAAIEAAAGPQIEPIATLAGKAGSVWAAAVSPDSTMVAVGTEGGTVRLWRIDDQRVVATLKAQRGIVWSLAWSDDGYELATCGDEGTAKIWDLSTRLARREFSMGGAVRSIAWDADPNHLITADRSGGLYVWDIASGSPEQLKDLESSRFTVSLSPKDRMMADAGNDGVITIRDADTLESRLELKGHQGPVLSITFSPDGRRLASGGWDKRVRLWDVGNGDLVREFAEVAGDIWSVAFSPDGLYLAGACQDGLVRVWNAVSGEVLRELKGHQVAVHTVSISRNGEYLISGGRDGAVRVWSMKTVLGQD